METLAAAPLAHPALARHDIYRNIHKGLRAAMFDIVQRYGSLDTADAAQMRRLHDDAQQLFAVLAAHVKHENNFVHAAIEARRPGGAQATADLHVEHLETLAALTDESAALLHAAPDQRELLAARVYRYLALFVGENLDHMHHEETANNAALWSLYSDAEVIEVHDRLVASIEPPMLMACLRYMARALNPRELFELLNEIRAKAPLEVFQAILAQAYDAIELPKWERLAADLGLMRPQDYVDL